MAARVSAGQAVKAVVLVGGLFAVKAPVMAMIIRRRQQRERELRSNRLQFAKLPRHKQRAVIAHRRAQLRDLEAIYRRGYRPKRSPELPRPRRRW